MGTNTLIQATRGQIIKKTLINQYYTALNGDLVPRKETTGAPTDVSGSLGSSIARWDDMCTKEINVGLSSSGIAIKESAGNGFSLWRGGSEQMTIESVVNAPDQSWTQDNFKTVSIGTAQDNLSRSGSVSSNTNSNTLVDVPSASTTLTTKGRPVLIMCTSIDGSVALSTIANKFLVSGGVGYISFTYALLRDSTVLGRYHCVHYLFLSDIASLSQDYDFEFPSSVLKFIDLPGAGTYTYKLQYLTASLPLGNYRTYANSLQLKAVEL